MTNRTKSHLTYLMTSGGATDAAGQKHMILEASISGINDSYLVIVGIGVVGLLLSFFIKQVGQAKEESTATLKKAVPHKV
ncbi:hypothetical protein D3C71_2180110 [compost metagenome]